MRSSSMEGEGSRLRRLVLPGHPAPAIPLRLRRIHCVLIRRGVFASLGLALVMASSLVRAEEARADSTAAPDHVKDVAAEAFWNGKKAYDEGRFEQAGEHFHEAYVLTNDPELLYNIGQTYRQIDDCRRALAAYQDFLRLAPNSPLAQRTEKQVVSLQSSCSPTAEDSEVPDAAPVEPSPRVAPTSAEQPLLGGSQAPLEQTPPRDTAKQAEPRHPLRTWTWAALAAGAVAGGTALGLGIWNYQRRDRWHDRDQGLVRGPAFHESDVDWLERQRANDDLAISINAMNPVVAGVGLGAAALFVTSAVLYLATPDKPRKKGVASKRLDVGCPIIAVDSRSIYASLGTSF